MPPSATDKPPASVAKIIARRATDLLAISIVAVFGLAAGREIIAWWRTDSVTIPPASGVADPFVEWSSRPLELQFGESSTAIRRIPFRGDRTAASRRLIHLAREALEQTDPAIQPITQEESEWIAALKKLEPEESQPDLGTIYSVPGFLPSVAAMREISSADDGEDSEQLVAWGLALSAGENAWTLLMFQPSTSIDPDTRRVVLPPGAETLLSWCDAAANQVISFRGRGRITDWLTEFDRQFGPPTTRQIAPNDDRAAARWRLPTGTADVQLSRSSDEITGLLWITAATSGHNGD